jgi:hypothetical protein
MARPIKFTPEVVRQIRPLIDQGLTPRAIADTIGCTLGTLRVKCSKLRISLRQKRRNETETADEQLKSAPCPSVGRISASSQLVPSQSGKARRAKVPSSSLRPSNSLRANDGRAAMEDRALLSVKLPQTIIDQLRQRAREKGMSGSTLASVLLEIIAHDDLYEALLDGDWGAPRSTGQTVAA